MAKRPSVKEILELARKGGAAQPEAVSAEAAPVEEVAAPEAEPAVEAAAPSAPAANVPTAASLGRPLTLKEKLAAARAGGTPAPAPAPSKPAAAVVRSPRPSDAGRRKRPREGRASSGRTARPAHDAQREAGGGPRAAGSALRRHPPGERVQSRLRNQAARPPPRPPLALELSPLDKITDPKDLAEAARQTGAKKAKEVAAKLAENAPAKPAKAAPKEVKPQTVLPKPGRAGRRSWHCGPPPEASRRAASSWVPSRRFSCPDRHRLVHPSRLGMAVLGCRDARTVHVPSNVLAEPPSTVKVGVPRRLRIPRRRERAVSSRSGASGSSGLDEVQRPRTSSSPSSRSAPTSAAPPTGWAASRNSSARATAAAFTSPGSILRGPAPRPLERFKVSMADDGQILVDKSQKFQEELAQWSDPDSFLPAV